MAWGARQRSGAPRGVYDGNPMPAQTPDDAAPIRRRRPHHWLRITLSLTALLALVSVAAIVYGPSLWWKRGAPQQRTVLIVDESGARFRQEHAGIAWLLNHHHVVQGAGNAHRAHRFDEDAIIRDLALVPAVEADVLYLADVQQLGHKDIAALEAVGAQMIVAEYRTLEAAQRGVVGQLADDLGVRPTGWIGKCVADLADDGAALVRVRRSWQLQNRGKRWSFRGQGCVLSRADGRVVILRHGSELRHASVELSVTPAGRKMWGDAVTGGPWVGWFDLVAPQKGTRQLAQLRIPVTRAGAVKLKKVGIDNATFPGVTIVAREKHQTMFLAVDASDQPGLPDDDRAGTVWWHQRVDTGGVNRQLYWSMIEPMLARELTR